MKALMISLLVLFSPLVLADITPQDREECMALGQITASVIYFKGQGVTQEDIWSVYDDRGADPRLRKVIEALAAFVYSPEFSNLNAGDFIGVVVEGCLKKRDE